MSAHPRTTLGNPQTHSRLFPSQLGATDDYCPMAISYPVLPYLKRLSSRPRCPIYLAKLLFDTSLNDLLRLQETKARRTLDHGSLQHRVNTCQWSRDLRNKSVITNELSLPSSLLTWSSGKSLSQKVSGDPGENKDFIISRSRIQLP